jgi:hypothetical protein
MSTGSISKGFSAGVCALVLFGFGGLGTVTGTLPRPKNLAGLLSPEFHSAYQMFLSGCRMPLIVIRA